MRIAVVNGSPKGEDSITLFTVKYLQKRFPGHEFRYISAAAGIRTYERERGEARKVLEEAELVLFSYPVYTFLAPSQLHRFLELLKEDVAGGKLSLEGKYVSQITTSKHFYDVTAHRFIEENCRDLGMKPIRGLSADMEDLTQKKGRRDAEQFFRYLVWNMEREKEGRESSPAVPDAVSGTASDADPEVAPGAVSVTEESSETASAADPVVIVADLGEEDRELQGMIACFREALGLPSRLVNLRDFPFRGGCLGCLRCASTGECIYKDGFQELLRDQIQKGSATVYAFTIRDHSMGSHFKTYDDRQFCNGHRTVTMGSPVAYLIRGEYRKEENLRLVLEARAEVGGNFFAGAVADENGRVGADTLKEQIGEMAAQVRYSIQEKYAPPSNFLGEGGRKIFRDLIYQMRGLMKADHKFFKEKGLYDFPQKKKGSILLMYLVGALMRSKKMQKKMGDQMKAGMKMPYQRVLDQVKEPCEPPFLAGSAIHRNPSRKSLTQEAQDGKQEEAETEKPILLYVNGCMRRHSRTEQLAWHYLNQNYPADQYQWKEIKVSDLDIAPLKEADILQRDEDIAAGNLNQRKYALAQAFASAHAIVVAAPYWDASFPSELKVFFEHICVAGITFGYDSQGSPVKKCKADCLVYLTTSGGYLPNHPSVQAYLEELCRLFSIPDCRFYAAEGLDIHPDQVEEILEHTWKGFLSV